MTNEEQLEIEESFVKEKEIRQGSVPKYLTFEQISWIIQWACKEIEKRTNKTCKWKKITEVTEEQFYLLGKYKTQCENTFADKKTYCPNCGGKIIQEEKWII